MSLNNDYTVRILAKQKHAEFLQRAAEERLAARVPRRPSTWRRIVRAVTRRPGGAGGDRRPAPSSAGVRVPIRPSTASPAAPGVDVTSTVDLCG